MFRNPFDGARAKIERTATHFKELVSLQVEFGAEQPLSLETEQFDNGDTGVLARIKSLPPLSIATIVADILGGFRSALDIATVQACIARGETSKKRLEKTYFAFGGDERDWGLNCDRRMAGADAAIRSVVASFKPWKTDGNELLYGLGKLSSKDKHIDLVPIGSRTEQLTVDGLKLSRPGGGLCELRHRVPIWGSTDKVILLTVVAPAQVEIIGPSVLKAGIGFAWDAPALPGYPVVPTLNEMGSMCEQIIDSLEAATKL